MNNQTVVHIPQWMMDVHEWRNEFFLTNIEPVIVYLFGEVEEDYELSGGDRTRTVNDFVESERRRLGYLPDYVYDASAYKETSMSFATLTMLFTIMSCIAIVFLSCFYHNQKTSPLFSSPRRHRLPKLVPPPLPVDGTFSWIKICFFMSDEEIINRIGYDSLIFLRFHRLALRCIVKMGIFSFCVLLPINFTGGGHANASDLKGYVGSLLLTDFDRFTMANVTGGSPRLWVHCIAAYLLSGIVMRELVVEYNAFNSIRHRYMLSKEPHLRTVLVTNIPRHLRSAKKIKNYFRHVYPDAVKNVTMCQNLIQLEKLVGDRQKILMKIEKELLLLCRNEKRKLYGESTLRSCSTSLTRSPFFLCESIGVLNGTQERLERLYSRLEKLNTLVQAEIKRRFRVMKKLDGMEANIGRKDIDYILATPFIDDDSVSPSTSSDETLGYTQFVDDSETGEKKKRKPFNKAKQAIKMYSKSIIDVDLVGNTSRRGEEVRQHDRIGDNIENHTNEVTDKAFIEMKTFTASTIAIQSMHSSKPGAMEVTTSPEPRDVLWNNVYVSKGARRTRAYIGEILVILLIAFYVVPVALVSLLVSDSALKSSSPRLAQLCDASAFFASAVSMVQPICLVVIQQLLPPLFIQISKAEGHVSFSEVQMKAFSRYFMFQVLNVFLVTAIAGSIFDTLAIIIQNPEKAFEILGNSLPKMSSFFITLVTMKSFLGLGMELVRTLSIVQQIARYILFPVSTLREKKNVRIGMRAIDDPGWFPFHKILAQDMLVVVVSVVFAVIAPIVLFPCALYCLFSRIMWTHHHLYIYESVFESGGQFWPKIFRRFVFGLIIAQMTITGQFILKEARHEAYATMALMVLTYYFLRNTRARFDAPSSTLPLEVATIMDITVAQEREGRGMSKTHDSDNSNAADNDEDYEKLGDLDPFENAYCQPALRANPLARPEQPFQPAQLGREDIFMKDPTLFEAGYNPSSETNDSTATVRLKSLNQRDRRALNFWWHQQVLAAGKQRVLSVFVGEESGTLRLGKKTLHEI